MFGITIFSLLIFKNDTIAEDAQLKALFTGRAVKGTLVISSYDSKTEYFYNKKRSEKRFLPASTFKMPNTLTVSKEAYSTFEKDNDC